MLNRGRTVILWGGIAVLLCCVAIWLINTSANAGDVEHVPREQLDPGELPGLSRRKQDDRQAGVATIPLTEESTASRTSRPTDGATIVGGIDWAVADFSGVRALLYDLVRKKDHRQVNKEKLTSLKKGSGFRFENVSFGKKTLQLSGFCGGDYQVGVLELTIDEPKVYDLGSNLLIPMSGCEVRIRVLDEDGNPLRALLGVSTYGSGANFAVYTDGGGQVVFRGLNEAFTFSVFARGFARQVFRVLPESHRNNFNPSIFSRDGRIHTGEIIVFSDSLTVVRDIVLKRPRKPSGSLTLQVPEADRGLIIVVHGYSKSGGHGLPVPEFTKTMMGTTTYALDAGEYRLVAAAGSWSRVPTGLRLEPVKWFSGDVLLDPDCSVELKLVPGARIEGVVTLDGAAAASVDVAYFPLPGVAMPSPVIGTKTDAAGRFSLCVPPTESCELQFTLPDSVTSGRPTKFRRTIAVGTQGIVNVGRIPLGDG